MMCGYMLCDDPLFDPQMRALPPVFVVSPSGAAGKWVRAGVEYAMHQTTLVGDDRFEVSLGGPVKARDDVARWEDAGVDRLIVAPWERSREALEGMRRFAAEVFL